jgi:ComEC/Rec2-related protein
MWYVYVNTIGQTTSNINRSESKFTQYRILSTEKDYFGQTITYLQSKQGIFQTKDTITQKEGEQLLLQAKQEPFDPTDPLERRFLSQNIFGILKSVKVVAIATCDLECKFIQHRSQLSRTIDAYFLSQSCQDNRFISAFFAPNVECQDIAQLSKGLLIGGVKFSQGIRPLFVSAGISHVVAVSGYQIVLLAGAIEWLAFRLRVKRTTQILFSIILVMLFAAFVGLQPPIVRSALALVFSAGAILLGRQIPVLKVLIYSALVMLLVNPWYIYSPSFQLSFLASFGIFAASAGTPLIQKIAPYKSIQTCLELLLINITIFITTLPVVTYLGKGVVSPWSIVTNFFITPLIPIISILNIVSLLPFIGGFVFIFPLSISSVLLQFVSSHFQNSFTITISQFSALELVIYYIIFVALTCFVRFQTLKLASYEKKKTLESTKV